MTDDRNMVLTTLAALDAGYTALMEGRATLWTAREVKAMRDAMTVLIEDNKDLGKSAISLAVQRAEFRIDRDALAAALQKLMAVDVKGHQLQDRLQFSTPGREILDECRAALDRVRSI